MSRVGVTLIATILGAACFWAAFRPAGALAVPAELTLKPVVLGSDHRAMLHARNTGWLKSAVIEGISTTCGCVSVVSRSARIAPREILQIELHVRPGSHDQRFESTVRLVDARGRESRTIVRGMTIEPFEGWPRQARVRSAESGWVLPLAAAYRGSVRSVAAFGHDGKAVAAVLADDGTSVHLSKEVPSRIVVEFGSNAVDATVWDGPVVVSEE